MHGDADRVTLVEARKLFDSSGGIIVRERYRDDRNSAAAQAFRTD
jgi:type IV secretion system protein VirD4